MKTIGVVTPKTYGTLVSQRCLVTVYQMKEKNFKICHRSMDDTFEFDYSDSVSMFEQMHGGY